MATFAVINADNLVTNIIVTDDKEQGERDLAVTLAEYTDENPAGIGWTYDAATGVFIAPSSGEVTNADD